MFRMLTLFVLLLLFTLCTFIPTVSGQTGPVLTFQYTVFTRGGSPFVQDGANNTGVFCRPGVGAVALDGYTVAFCDMCGSGSAIRVINWTTEGSVMSTLVGSLTETGDIDGSATEALFSGSNDGNPFANGLTLVDNDLYLADTYNNAIRKISLPEASVSTYVNRSMAPAGTSFGQPAALTPFQSSATEINLLVSDTENNRILYVPLNSQQILVPEFADGTQPGWLAVEYSSQYVFTVTETTTILAHPIINSGGWVPYGNTSCMGYRSALLLIETSPPELLYFGSVNGTVGVYAIPANLPLNSSNTTCPTLRYNWTLPDENVVSLISRDQSFNGLVGADENDDSIFALTTRGLYALSNREIPMPPTTTTTTTTTSTSTSTPPVPPGTRAEAGFPANSLPHATLCERSGAYAAIFTDILNALGNNDNIYMRLIDLNSNSYVYFNRNNISLLSTMCNVSADNSTDNTVSFVEIYDPEGSSSEAMTAAMAQSNFSSTRNYLAGFASRGEQLDPFCFINCATQCRFMSMTNFTCPNTPPVVVGSSRCDGLCKGAIAASTVLGVSGAGLLALLVISPGTIFSALIMIPII